MIRIFFQFHQSLIAAVKTDVKEFKVQGLILQRLSGAVFHRNSHKFKLII